MSALERLARSPYPSRTVPPGFTVVRTKDLALALAVIEAAEHAAGLIDDRQYRDALSQALAALTKTEGEL